MSMLSIQHGEIRRGGRVILAAGSVNCALPAAVGIVGINGSGKSSLFMHLTRTLAGPGPAAHVSIAGRAVPNAGYAPQTPTLPGWLTADATAQLFGVDFDRLCADMPGLHLEELRGQRTARLSLGQRQALTVALAIASPAPLLVLDEPFASLDFRRRLGALELLRRWKIDQPQCALLVSSQNAADLVALCDHFVVLHQGRYVFNGSRAELARGAPDADILHACESRLLELLA